MAISALTAYMVCSGRGSFTSNSLRVLPDLCCFFDLPAMNFDLDEHPCDSQCRNAMALVTDTT